VGQCSHSFTKVSILHAKLYEINCRIHKGG
jgi:hypothetical protein